jgi:alkaline phosphatase
MRFLSLLFGLMPLVAVAQDPVSYTPNGHSHNDYAGKQPFTLAYASGFGSIEADVFLVHDTLWVGHVPKDVELRRSLDDLYLRPLAEHIRKNRGHAYPGKGHSLQMMIDIKTAAIPTLLALTREIERHPELVSAAGLTWTISGNRPADSSFLSYPRFIQFDGDITRPYEEGPMRRIPMMSADFTRISPWRVGPLEGALDSSSTSKLKALVIEVHRTGKKVRFWNAPDDPASWKILLALGVDYINTDRVEEFARYAQ